MTGSAKGKKTATLARSTKTGRIVKKSEVEANPAGTVVESVEQAKAIRRLRKLLKEAYANLDRGTDYKVRERIERELGL